MNFIEYVRQQIAWSGRTFGPGKRKKGVMDHIRKELKELEEATDPADELGEWIDIIILATDGAWRTGATAEQVALALFNKQTKNINRVWPDWRTMSEDQAIEHDRSADLAGMRGAWDYPYLCQRCGVKQWAQPKSECHNCGFTLVENHASPSQT